MAQTFIKRAWNSVFGSKPQLNQKSWESGHEQNLTYYDMAQFINGGLGGVTDNLPYPIWRFPTIARLAFEQNTVVYKCVMLRASALAGLSWKLYTIDKMGKKTQVHDRNHPLLKLIHAPNPAQGKATFMTRVEASRMLDGNIFIQMDGSAADKNFRGRAPSQIWNLRPDWVNIVPGPSYSRLAGEYIYMPGGVSQGNYQTFPVDPSTGESNIIHIESYSPLYEETMMRGLSPIRSAIYQILTHNSGQHWNYSLLKNAARPAGVFTTDGGNDDQPDLTTEQLSDLRRELTNIYGSPENAGRPLVLQGGFKWTEMSKTPMEMDFIGLKNSAARDIANICGVPAQLLGIPGDNTFSNYHEARASFYEDSVIPSARALCDELNRRLVPKFGNNLWLEIDLDDILALSGRRETKMASISAANFLTINEKRHTMGFETITDGDVLLVPAMTTTLQTVIAPVQPPDEPEILDPDEKDGVED